MPTVLRSGPYRLYFFSHEGSEPAHIHVDRERFTAKFWLKPVSLAYNLGFKARELGRIEALVAEHGPELLEAWNAYFRTQGG